MKSQTVKNGIWSHSRCHFVVVGGGWGQTIPNVINGLAFDINDEECVGQHESGSFYVAFVKNWCAFVENWGKICRA